MWIDAAPRRPARADPRLTATYLVGGILEVVAAWLRDDEPAGVEELAEGLTSFLPPWFVTVTPAGRRAG